VAPSTAEPDQAQAISATSVATRRWRESDTSVPIITQPGRGPGRGRKGTRSAPGVPALTIAYNP